MKGKHWYFENKGQKGSLDRRSSGPKFDYTEGSVIRSFIRPKVQ